MKKLLAQVLLVGMLVAAMAAVAEVADDILKGAEPSPGEGRANVPIAVRGNTWYLQAQDGPVRLFLVDKPHSVTDARTGESIPYSYEGDTVTVEEPGAALLAVSWENDTYEKHMQDFAETDRAQAPAPGGVLFVGSSTIRGWDLDKFFPGLGALNRGFGGSDYSDLVYYFDRAILPYRPSVVVLYAGDNDIARGKSPERVFADFAALATKIRHRLPEARVVVLSIKPSMSRWEQWDTMRETNARIEEYAKANPQFSCIDTSTALLGPDGKPRPEFFQEDALHLNDPGYEALAALLRPLLRKH